MKAPKQLRVIYNLIIPPPAWSTDTIYTTKMYTEKLRLALTFSKDRRFWALLSTVGPVRQRFHKDDVSKPDLISVSLLITAVISNCRKSSSHSTQVAAFLFYYICSTQKTSLSVIVQSPCDSQQVYVIPAHASQITQKYSNYKPCGKLKIGELYFLSKDNGKYIKENQHYCPLLYK